MIPAHELEILKQAIANYEELWNDFLNEIDDSRWQRQEVAKNLNQAKIILKEYGMLKRISGNLLDLADAGEFNLIIHGCNCQNTMNNGIAKQIRERYPDAYTIDQNTTKGDSGSSQNDYE